MNDAKGGMSKFRERLIRWCRNFVVPEFNSRTRRRILAVAAVSAVVFGFLARPFFLHGESMLPTRGSRGLVFCNCLRYRWSRPRRGDIVVLSYFGRRYLLKRVIALPGETVEFRKGRVFLNGRELPEPYVRYRGDWDVKARTVAPGHLFVVGDNRGQHHVEHMFGEVAEDRVVGGLLF
ncbi:MAG: signal peptidase I [Lentisphaeria bacterium]|nr:signal peptidase I [Lentisphaeria bacterium]